MQLAHFVRQVIPLLDRKSKVFLDVVIQRRLKPAFGRMQVYPTGHPATSIVISNADGRAFRVIRVYTAQFWVEVMIVISWYSRFGCFVVGPNGANDGWLSTVWGVTLRRFLPKYEQVFQFQTLVPDQTAV